MAGLIASLVIGAVATALSQLGDAKRISRQRHAAFLRANAALEAMRRDVVSVIRSDDLFYTRLLVYSGSGAGFDRDEIVVFTTRLRAVRNIDNFNGEGVEYETQYRIEEDELGPVLWQRRDAVPEEYPLGGGIAVPLVDGTVGPIVVYLAVENHVAVDPRSDFGRDLRVEIQLAVFVEAVRISGR